jgi:hypothetical protein
MLHLPNPYRWAAAPMCLLALTACERFEQKGPVPTYHDSKLDVMRSISGEPLPTSHETNAIRADVARSTAAAQAEPAVPASAPKVAP